MEIVLHLKNSHVLQPREFMVQCGQAWKSASEEVKNKFKAQAQPEMDQWKRDLGVYNQRKRSKKTTGVMRDCYAQVLAMSNFGEALMVHLCSGSGSDEGEADPAPKEATDPVKANKKQKPSKKTGGHCEIFTRRFGSTQ